MYVFLQQTCLLQRWCLETFGEVRAIESLQMYDDHMTWLAAKKARCRTTVEIWHRARKHIATLAAFHGYLPSFDWRSSEVAKYELSQLVHDHSHAQAADTDGRTVRQDRHSLNADQLELLYIYAMSRSAAECALLLAFCGIMGQSLARSGQICKMNRVHISYSEANLPVTPLFGPVRLLHLGDRGHHKVNKTADMAHWVMRTMKPSLACPWIGLALKTALDAKQQQGVQYEELLSQCTGKLVSNTVAWYLHACTNIVTNLYIVCSAGDGADDRTCEEGEICGQGQIQNGTFVVCICAAGDRSAREAGQAFQESDHRGHDRHHCQRPEGSWHSPPEEGKEDKLDQGLFHCAADFTGR